jgi:hypothetical protein
VEEEFSPAAVRLSGGRLEGLISLRSTDIYGVYAVAGVVGLVVSTSLLLLVILARMKGGWSISAVVRMRLLRRPRAPTAVS